jgi:chemotaxis protein CheY-P-specific phosphatase CheC
MGLGFSFRELEEKIWKKIVAAGCEETSQALSAFLKKPIRMSGVVLGMVPLSKIPFLTGDPETPGIGARILCKKEIEGTILFIFPLSSWNQCKNLLFSQLPLADSLEMEISAFAEMANLAASYFIKHLANWTSLSIHFTPPEVIQDMLSVILEETLVFWCEKVNELLVVETLLSSDLSVLKGYLFFIPSPSDQKLLVEKMLEISSSFPDY